MSCCLKQFKVHYNYRHISPWSTENEKFSGLHFCFQKSQYHTDFLKKSNI